MSLKPNIASMSGYHPGLKVGRARKLSSNEKPLGPSNLALKALNESRGELHRYPACTLLRRKLI